MIFKDILPVGAKADHVSIFDGHPALVLALGVAVSISFDPSFGRSGPFRPNNAQAIVNVDNRWVIVCFENADIHLIHTHLSSCTKPFY
jgi:hypothetical protein